jgi:hypothetical protein
VPDTLRGADRDGFVTRAARCGRAIRFLTGAFFLTRALPGCIAAHLSQSRRRSIRRCPEDSDSESNATQSDREVGWDPALAYSFHDRLHGNIAQCVMLTRQHRSPKDRESLPYHERVQGERTPCRHQGWATIRVPQRIAAEWFCAQRRRGSFAGARASLPTEMPKMFPITRRLASRRRVGRFRSIINIETGRA